ncbi:MAG: archaeal proteasome endopeptidase complex subunit beta [Candidatus Odinarchaeum yellowstonii]|uniref:Proteasome subunit beta n=1 Tax=Odinarchaeota yellowstonii (strain LCB_4) TaxID=1841599 RepID=A0AAF0D188_ODILC|nr:MAG: archaeal proteasome endopeptidase complex subunit beta [Candidatus Odinarchaeum yellowstonii]
MAQELPEWVIGATTIGMVCSDGVVLASEKKLSLGTLIISKTVKKVFKITENIGAACAGLSSDFQALVRIIQAYANLYNLEVKKPITTRAAAKMMSNILFARKWIPLITETIVAGVDEAGPQLYTLDLIGSLIEDDFAAVGTGAKVAVGVLESKYRKNLTVVEGKELAILAVKTASERDIASGEGVDILTISKSGSEFSYTPLK